MNTAWQTDWQTPDTQPVMLTQPGGMQNMSVMNKVGNAQGIASLAQALAGLNAGRTPVMNAQGNEFLPPAGGGKLGY